MSLDHENKIKKEWGVQTLREIKDHYNRYVKGDSDYGLESLRLRTGKSFGEIDRFSFSLARYLIWLQKGAGKGKGGKKGSTWFFKDQRRKTNPNSFGKMNTGQRKKKDIINPVLERRVYDLAELVATFKADEVVKAIKIK